jgi:hypothetical protein
MHLTDRARVPGYQQASKREMDHYRTPCLPGLPNDAGVGLGRGSEHAQPVHSDCRSRYHCAGRARLLSMRQKSQAIRLISWPKRPVAGRRASDIYAMDAGLARSIRLHQWRDRVLAATHLPQLIRATPGKRRGRKATGLPSAGTRAAGPPVAGDTPPRLRRIAASG